MGNRIKLVSSKAYKESDDREGLGVIKVHSGAPTKVKAEDADGDNLVLDWVISTSVVDREQDTIAVDGWHLDNFRKGGSVIWAHDYKFPLTNIATPSAVRVEGDKLKSRARYTPKDLNPFGFMQYRLAAEGFLKSCSVGLRIIKSVDNNERGGWWPMDILEQELLEFSHAPVAANPEALVEATQRGIDVLPFRAWTEFQLDGEGALVVPRAYLESLHKAIPGGAKVFDMGAAKAKAPALPDLGLELGIDGADLLELLADEPTEPEPTADSSEPVIEYTSRACPDCIGRGLTKATEGGTREKCGTCQGTGNMPTNYDDIEAARKADEEEDEEHKDEGPICSHCGSTSLQLAAALEKLNAALKTVSGESAPDDAQDDEGERLPVPGLRRAVLPITWPLIRQAFGMPAGLKLVGCQVDPMTDTLVLFIDGDCLEEVGPDKDPPFVHAEFQFSPDLDEELEDGTVARTLRALWRQGDETLGDARIKMRVHKSGAVDYTDYTADEETALDILDPNEDQDTMIEFED